MFVTRGWLLQKQKDRSLHSSSTVSWLVLYIIYRVATSDLWLINTSLLLVMIIITKPGYSLRHPHTQVSKVKSLSLKTEQVRVHWVCEADDNSPVLLFVFQEAAGENAGVHGPAEDRKEKVPSPHLSQMVVLTNSGTLYGLAQRVVATESLWVSLHSREKLNENR